jgi:hypothetical protein
MTRKQFKVVGTIGPDTEMMGTTYAKVQEALSTGFEAQFKQHRDASRAAYVAWLETQPDDAFAPATHAEVLALYDKNCGSAGPTPGNGISVPERIAQSETIPDRKAALDRARVRRALATIRMEQIVKMDPEQAIEALCETPEGRAQYEHIRTRAPGSRYKPLSRRNDCVSPAELIASLATTSELAAEFEQASKEVREVLRLEGVRPSMQTLAEAVTELLVEAGYSLSSGVESSGSSEPEWSRSDKRLLGEMAVVIPRISPDKVQVANRADIQVALQLLVRARGSLAAGFESDGSSELEWSQADKALVNRINSVLGNVYATELLCSPPG